MGQLFAATNPKKRSCNEWEGEEAAGGAGHVHSDWYMNKMLKFKSRKVLYSASGCSSKTRSLKDLITEQCLPENQISSRPGLNEVSPNTSPEADTTKGHSIPASIQESDSDEDIEKLTLNDMKKLLKKSSTGSFKGTSAEYEDTASKKLESHFSSLSDRNSHEYIRSSSLMNTNDELGTVSQVDIASTENEIALKKKEMPDNPALEMDSQVNHDDSDAWTLEMWQVHKKGKGMSCRKKTKRQRKCTSQGTDGLSAPCPVDALPDACSSKRSINMVQSVDNCISGVSRSQTLSPTISPGRVALSSETLELGYEGITEGTYEPMDGIAGMEILNSSADVELGVEDSSENEIRKSSDVVNINSSDEGKLQNEEIKVGGTENERMMRNKVASVKSSDEAQPQNDFLILEQISENNSENKRKSTTKVASVNSSDDALPENEFLILKQFKADDPENGRMKINEVASVNFLDDAQLQNEFLSRRQNTEKNIKNERLTSGIASVNSSNDAHLQNEFLSLERIKQENLCFHDAILDGAKLSESDDGEKCGLLCGSNGSSDHYCNNMLEQDKIITELSECKESSNIDNCSGKTMKQNEQDTDINMCHEGLSPISFYGNETLRSEDSSPVDLYTAEKHDVEEEQFSDHVKPSKLPRKRKAISPLSQEKLIRASRMIEQDENHRGMRKFPRAIKCYIGRDNLNQELCNVNACSKDMAMTEVTPPMKFIHKEEAMPGSPCHNRKKPLFSKAVSSKAPPMMLPNDSPQMSVDIVLNSSDTTPHEEFESSNSKPPPKVSPQAPAKGILRLASPACKSACKCEECVSMRFRAERAAEFSQQQMHDIEGLTVKLLKELSTMKGALEEVLVQNMARTQSPRAVRSFDKARIAANNAQDVERMARSWLVRMARDCNRYCKIMRMQERKLSFADESGGQLCQVKLFHSQERQPADNAVNLPRSSTDDCSNEILASSIVEGPL